MATAWFLERFLPLLLAFLRCLCSQGAPLPSFSQAKPPARGAYKGVGKMVQPQSYMLHTAQPWSRVASSGT